MIVNRYISINLPIPNAKTSVVLAGLKGAIAYKMKDKMKDMISDGFILQHAAPAIQAVMGDGMALLLG